MSRFPGDNFRSSAALGRLLLTAILGLGLDLWTKHYAFETLATRTVEPDGTVRYQPASAYELIPGWLHFEITTNRGAVFGFGQGQLWLFIGVSAAATGFLFYLFAASGRQRMYQILLGMLLAGVLGNLYDRVTYGYVRDMIHALPDKRWSDVLGALPDAAIFPWIFNVADCLLCVGVAAMVGYSLLDAPKKVDQTDAAKTLDA